MNRLSFIALLTGVLALVGCGDDTGNAGGSAGSGGIAGSGGTGGTGGTEECEQTCGVDNEFPLGAPVGTGIFDCNVMDTNIPLTFEIAAGVDEELVEGENEITVSIRSIVPIEVVNLMLNTVSSATIISTEGTVTTDQTPSSIMGGLSPVPCDICYEQDVEVIVNVNPVTEIFTVVGGSIEFILETVSITLDDGDMMLELSNTGDMPLCGWMNDAPPLISLDVTN